MGAAKAYDQGTNKSDGNGGWYLDRVECDINVSLRMFSPNIVDCTATETSCKLEILD